MERDTRIQLYTAKYGRILTVIYGTVNNGFY